ncbi:hypothetical protein DFH29DRAFT_1009496 [Suillus ampliporus]|nr:hypothetical protein DFH29DRAFT_1009496 [Suillus ampliporus]
MMDAFDIQVLNCSRNLTLMSASALSSLHWLDLARDGTDALTFTLNIEAHIWLAGWLAAQHRNISPTPHHRSELNKINNTFDLIKDIFSEQIVVPACKKSFNMDWKNAPSKVSSSNAGGGWIVEENNMFQQGSQGSAPTTPNWTQSAPTTTPNQTHRAPRPHRQPSQLSQWPNPLNPPEALGSSRWTGNQQHSTPRRQTMQAGRQSRHVHFDVASDSEVSTSTPNILMAPPPLRIQPTPLPSVTTRSPIVLVESDTDTDSSLSPEEAEDRLSLAPHGSNAQPPVTLSCRACNRPHTHVIIIPHPPSLTNSPPPAYESSIRNSEGSGTQ